MIFISKAFFILGPKVCSTSPGKVITPVLNDEASNMNILSLDMSAQIVIKMTSKINPEFLALAKNHKYYLQGKAKNPEPIAKLIRAMID